MKKELSFGENPDNVNVVMETPLKSSVKYELEKDLNMVKVDRVLHSSMHYPANYGFVPQTLSGDGDPSDVLVISDYSFAPGTFVKVRLIGVLLMEDEGGIDEKLIAVPIDKVDPESIGINNIQNLSEHVRKKIKNFFETYKMLEPNKWVKVKDFQDKAKASELLAEAIKNYKNKN